MITSLDEALINLQLFTDQVDYAIIKLPRKAVIAAASILAEIGEPFTALIVDKDEITLVIPSEAMEDFTARIPGHIASKETYRLITLDVELDLSVVGFMSHISRVLASASISIFPLAAYSHDHLLVTEDQFGQALQILEKLKSDQ